MEQTRTMTEASISAPGLQRRSKKSQMEMFLISKFPRSNPRKSPKAWIRRSTESRINPYLMTSEMKLQQVIVPAPREEEREQRGWRTTTRLTNEKKINDFRGTSSAGSVL